MSIIDFLFKKSIEKRAKEMLKDLVIEKYIGENLFIDTTNGLELQMRGYKFVQFFAAALYEIVQPAENYVTFDLNASGYEPMNVVIQKKSKISMMRERS